MTTDTTTEQAAERQAPAPETSARDGHAPPAPTEATPDGNATLSVTRTIRAAIHQRQLAQTGR
jgi:hypothetical protein